MLSYVIVIYFGVLVVGFVFFFIATFVWHSVCKENVLDTTTLSVSAQPTSHTYRTFAPLFVLNICSYSHNNFKKKKKFILQYLNFYFCYTKCKKTCTQTRMRQMFTLSRKIIAISQKSKIKIFYFCYTKCKIFHIQVFHLYSIAQNICNLIT